MEMRTLQTGMGWFPQQAGGLNRVFYYLMNHLPAVGVEARGLVTGTPARNGSANPNVSFFAPTASSLPTRWRGIRTAARSLVRDEAVDLVAAHFAIYAFPLMGVTSSLPMVVHFHGPWALESEVEGNPGIVVRMKKALEMAVYRKAARFIVLSEAFRDVLINHYEIPAQRIHIVPGGVEVDTYDVGVSRAEARARLGWPADRPTLIVVRRLARRMGLETLIDAMQEVVRQDPEALLMMAGKGPLGDTLQAQIESLGLQHNVRLLGFVPDEDLPYAYRAADFSVVPTASLEGFGLITVESLAAGTPVLVTPIGGLPEVVRDLDANLILKGSDRASLAEGVLGVLQGRIELPRAEACLHYARSRHDWRVIAAQTRDVYREVLGG